MNAAFRHAVLMEMIMQFAKIPLAGLQLVVWQRLWLILLWAVFVISNEMNYIFCAPINLVELLMNSFASILTTSVPIGLHAITFINNIHFIIQMTTISVMIIVNRLSARYGCTQHFNTPHSTISRRTPLHALPLNSLMHYNIDWIQSDEIHFNF